MLTKDEDKPKYEHVVYAKGGPMFDESDPIERILVNDLVKLLNQRTDKIKKSLGIPLEQS